MKKALLIGALAWAVINAGCSKNEGKKPELPTTTVVTETTVPAATTTTVAPPALPEGISCSPAGMGLYCGNPVWFGLPKCAGDSDGSIYFKDKAALLAKIKSDASWNSCVSIDQKPIPEVSGFGPCLPCASRVQAKMLKVGGGLFSAVDRSWKPGKK